MRSLSRALLSSTILVAALAACGGGGGGTTPPTLNPTPVRSYLLTARCIAESGCNNPSTRASARFRTVQDVSPSPAPVLNTGSIPQFVLFSTPDRYTKGPPALSNYAFTLFAYLDTSNGSTAPSPLPAVTWTKYGASSSAISESVVSNPASVAGTPPNTLAPGYFIKGSSSPGQVIYEASALNQYAPFYVNTYYALGVSSGSNDPNGYNACLKFDLAGIAEQVGSNCDVAIDANGIHIGVAGVFLPSTSMLVQVDTTGYAAQQGTLPLDKGTMDVLTQHGTAISYLAKLADGRYAMLYMQSFVVDSASHIQVMFAPYKVSDGTGHFAY